MNYYNGQYEQHLTVKIESDNHDLTRKITRLIKNLCDAWYFNIKYNESKSARSGDVLIRQLHITQTAYSADIITFRETLRCVCFHYELHTSVSIGIIDHRTTAIENTFDFPR